MGVFQNRKGLKILNLDLPIRLNKIKWQNIVFSTIYGGDLPTRIITRKTVQNVQNAYRHHQRVPTGYVLILMVRDADLFSILFKQGLLVLCVDGSLNTQCVFAVEIGPYF